MNSSLKAWSLETFSSLSCLSMYISASNSALELSKHLLTQKSLLRSSLACF